MRALPLLLLLSCTRLVPPSHTVLDRAPTAAEAKTRPRAATQARQERWILRRGKTEIVFTLLIEFSDGIQWVALDDFGGVLADSSGVSSRPIPAAMAKRLAQLLRAKYAPRNLRLVQVGADTGWAEPDVLWIGDYLHTQGIRAHRLGPQRYDVAGALTATVTIG